MGTESREDQAAEEECEEGNEDQNSADQDDCEAQKDQCPVLPGGALKVLFVITPIVVIVNVHFAFVLYTHYKNSKRGPEEGGCEDPEGPDYDVFEDE